ncbi:MAG: glutamate racemase [Clostridia bacterium]
MNNKPIGVFDSGLGGLTVLKELRKIMPREDIIYFGDSKRAPYGTKSQSTIVEFSFQNIRFLLEQGVKAVVIACNTASSNAMDEITRSFPLPVAEVIRPGAESGIAATRNGRLGVIGTDATIRSKAYEMAIREMSPGTAVFSKSCPLFVPLVEESVDLWTSKVVETVAQGYLEDLQTQGVDTLILGCTHYPLIEGIIQKVMGSGVKLINSARSVAGKTREILTDLGLEAGRDVGSTVLYTSDSVEKFIRMSKAILDEEVSNIQKIDIERF